MSYIVVAYGSVELDRAYKDPGNLTVYGPYADNAEAEAVATLTSEFDDYGNGFVGPTVAEVIDLSALDNAFDVVEYLKDEVEWDRLPDDDDPEAKALEQLMPNWRGKVPEIEAQMAAAMAEWEREHPEIVARRTEDETSRRARLGLLQKEL